MRTRTRRQPEPLKTRGERFLQEIQEEIEKLERQREYWREQVNKVEDTRQKRLLRLLKERMKQYNGTILTYADIARLMMVSYQSVYQWWTSNVTPQPRNMRDLEKLCFEIPCEKIELALLNGASAV